jgi:predicted small lipoprotein YifL
MKSNLKSIIRLTPLLILSLGLFSVTACKKKGPMEKAGESVDKAVEKTTDAVKDATN